MWIRLLTTATVLAGGAVLGRRALNRAVEKKIPVEIEAAKEAASIELDKRIGQFIRERLSAFLISLAMKTGLIASFYLLYSYGELTALGLKVVAGALVAGFLVRDAARTLPYLAPAIRHVRKHQWSPRRSVKELVAGVAFERAYAKAIAAAETGPHRQWVALSKYSAHSISLEVAEAVAELARATSLQRAKWRTILALLIGGATFCVYLLFLMVTIGAA